MTDSLPVFIAVILRIVSNPLGNVLQKKLTSQTVHPLILNFVTYFLLSLVCVIFALFWERPSLTSTFWIYSIIGGLAGAVGNGFLVRALHKGELSVLGPINAYKSVVGLIVGLFLLSELPNFWGLLGVFLIIGGSYFVLDTTKEKFTFVLLKRKEIRFRIWAMILTAIEAVFIKKIIISSSTSIAFFSWCFFGTFFSFFLLLIYRLELKKECRETFRSHNLLKYLALILCIGTMQLTTNYTFDHMSVGYALSLFQLSIILSVLFGFQFFKEKEIGKKIIGSCIMIIGSILIILLKS